MGYSLAILVLIAGSLTLAALGQFRNRRQWETLRQVLDNGDFRVSTREGKAVDSAAFLDAVGSAARHPLTPPPAVYSMALCGGDWSRSCSSCMRK